MNAFHRRHRLRQRRFIGRAQFGGSEHQQRAQALAAAEGDIAHCFVQPFGALRFGRQRARKHQLGLRLRAGLPAVQIIRLQG